MRRVVNLGPGGPRAAAANDHFAALVESSLDAIIGKDLDGIVTSWNVGAELLFGHRACEMIGSPLARLIPADRLPEEQLALERLRRGEPVRPLETVRRASDGRLVDVSVTVSPIKDARGRIVGASSVARDITALKHSERERVRLTRLYAALNQVNQAIVWSKTRDELFGKVCRALVELGGLRMAWIGWNDAATRRIVPLAEFGDAQGYLPGIEVHSDDGPWGLGPSGTAFRTGSPVICNDLLDDPASRPWQSSMLRCGFRASASLPIRLQGAVSGVITVYADRPDFFNDNEVALLTGAATDISFALDNFAREAARRDAEQALLHEKAFSDNMLESMPGVVYFYDATGRFLRWNRNFEVVSGYSAQEIAGMHPLDFFAPADRPRVQQRIDQALASGDASVEADLVARDGRATPYFFTGKRVCAGDMPCLVGVGIDISERKRAETALRDAELRFHTLFEQTPVGVVVIDPAGATIIESNEQAALQLGYSTREFVGLRVADLEDEAARSASRAHVDRLLAEGRSQFETRHRSKDGGVRDVFVSARAIVLAGRQLIHCVFLDITADKQAQDALRQSEQRIRSTLDGVLEGCQLLDFDWRYLYLNQTACAHNRRPGTELLGRTLQQAWPGIERTDAYALMRRGMEHRQPVQQEIEFVFPDGAKAWFDLRVRPVAEGILLLSVDVTERKLAERALLELNAQLEQKVVARTGELRSALVRAEAADRLKSAFLATMSHELRTPLNSIIGFTGTVLQGLAGPLNAEQAKQLGMVKSSARHLLALVNDVLDLSKIEAGQLEVACAPFELGRAIDQVVSLVTPQVRDKGLALDLQIAPEFGNAVGDERRFKQILLNLLSNAVKFTDRGRISVVADRVAAAAGPAAVRVQVADTGIGIRPDDLPTLFEPFRQLDSGLARQREGTGLGLAICRRLAGLMGGEIAVESRWGRGSTFSVTLPLDARNRR